MNINNKWMIANVYDKLNELKKTKPTFKDKLKCYSESANFHIEWDIDIGYDKFLDKDKKLNKQAVKTYFEYRNHNYDNIRCLCNRNIKNFIILKNRINNLEIVVGVTCFKKIFGISYKKASKKYNNKDKNKNYIYESNIDNWDLLNYVTQLMSRQHRDEYKSVLLKEIMQNELFKKFAKLTNI